METLTFGLAADELELFLQDVNENLQALEEGILSLEQAADPEILNAAFRAAHTLKALGGAIQHSRMAEMTHALENLFDALRSGQLASTPTLGDELLATVDVLRALRDEVVTGRPSGIDTAPLVARLRAIPTQAHTPAPAHSSPAPTPADNLWSHLAIPLLTAEQVNQTHQAMAVGLTLWEVGMLADAEGFAAARFFQAQLSLQEIGTILTQQPAEDDLLSDIQEGKFWVLLATKEPVSALESRLKNISDLNAFELRPFAAEPTEAIKKSTRSTSLEQDKTVRISVERLDTLMDLVGELVTDRTRLIQTEKQLREQYGKSENISGLNTTISHLGQIIDQLQGEVMHARMLPISQLFDKFPRQVRDLARDLNKQIDFIIEGEATELDRSLIEAVSDPLVHLLRNAIDHGLESPQDRQRAGKSETGTLRLTAAHAESQIIITVQDDGRGIDPQRTRRAAVSRGVMTSEEAARLSNDEAVALIFRPGFSTAEKVTGISGRGVGLDVVQTNISRMGGTVMVESELGQGSTFRIALPLTLAIVQTMIVSIGEDVYAIPLTNIIESLDLSRIKIHTVKNIPAINWRNEVLPLLYLHQFFHNPYAESCPASRKPAVIAVTWGRLQAGLVVDKILGKQEIVVKPLGPVIGNILGISGCTILGNGRIALIIDVPGLINIALQTIKGERV